MAGTNQRIGEMLVAEGIVTPEQVQEALAKQQAEGGKTIENLIELGHLDKEALHNFLSKQEGIVGIDLSNYELSDTLKELVPKELAESSLVLPIDKMGKLLTVAMACPLDTETIAKVQEHSGLRVKAMLCKYDDIKAGVEKIYTERESTPADFSFVHSSGGGGATASAGAKLITGALEKLTYIAPAPDAIEQASQVANSKDADIRKLVDIIATDPGMTAWMLNVGNSAAYGLAQQVVSVALAGALMGREGAAKVLDMLSAQNGQAKVPLDFTSVRRRAVLCSGAARHMASVAGMSRAAMGTAGLLHEVGGIALMQVKADKYSKVDPKLFGAERIEAEKKAVGIAYPEAGYLVLSAWNLPDTITRMVRRQANHTEAPEEYQAAAAVIGAASILAVPASADAPIKPDEAVKQAAARLQEAGLDSKIATDAFKAGAAMLKASFSK